MGSQYHIAPKMLIVNGQVSLNTDSRTQNLEGTQLDPPGFGPLGPSIRCSLVFTFLAVKGVPYYLRPNPGNPQAALSNPSGSPSAKDSGANDTSRGPGGLPCGFWKRSGRRRANQDSGRHRYIPGKYPQFCKNSHIYPWRGNSGGFVGCPLSMRDLSWLLGKYPQSLQKIAANIHEWETECRRFQREPCEYLGDIVRHPIFGLY